MMDTMEQDHFTSSQAAPMVKVTGKQHHQRQITTGLTSTVLIIKTLSNAFHIRHVPDHVEGFEASRSDPNANTRGGEECRVVRPF